MYQVYKAQNMNALRTRCVRMDIGWVTKTYLHRRKYVNLIRQFLPQLFKVYTHEFDVCLPDFIGWFLQKYLPVQKKLGLQY